MALAMTRPTKDSRGIYEYKTRYPKDLALHESWCSSYFY